MAEKNDENEENLLRWVVAHELGHCVNAHHHGEGKGRNGSHSGNQICIMRYFDVGEETIGSDLCDDRNKNNNLAAGYGNCAAKRGDCEHQHRVNGKPPAPESRD